MVSASSSCYLRGVQGKAVTYRVYRVKLFRTGCVGLITHQCCWATARTVREDPLHVLLLCAQHRQHATKDGRKKGRVRERESQGKDTGAEGEEQ